jgi:hypothetical protein
MDWDWDWDRNEEGAITLAPLTKFGTAVLGEVACGVRLQFARTPDQLRDGPLEALQFVLTAAQAHELARALTGTANKILTSRPKGRRTERSSWCAGARAARRTVTQGRITLAWSPGSTPCRYCYPSSSPRSTQTWPGITSHGARACPPRPRRGRATAPAGRPSPRGSRERAAGREGGPGGHALGSPRDRGEPVRWGEAGDAAPVSAIGPIGPRRLGTGIRLVFHLVEPHASTPEMHDALDGLMTASDTASLKLAVNRLETAFAGAGGP